MLLAGLGLAWCASSGEAQLFGKKNKTPPQQRVPELIGIVKLDKDNHKRESAAEELRQYDPAQFPEIIPVLIDVLQTDPSVGVRIEAATSLGRLRPISVPAGQALEKAASSDSNLRVRLQARTSLTYYQLSGYHTPKAGNPKEVTTGPALKGGPTTDEPPLAGGSQEQWWKNGQPADKGPAMPGPAQGAGYRPLPSGPTPSKTVPVVTGPASSPQSPPQPIPEPTVQTNPPPLSPTPEPTWVPAREEGPSLAPPKQMTR
jgi:hypothetical protein